MTGRNKKNKLLIIEDEPGVTTFIKRGLVENNFLVEIAMDGYVGLKMALANIYDLIVLDIGLPKIDGLEICKTLRDKGIQTPILMLTAFGSIDDKLAGYKVGADDYLVKPFEFAELLARIYAILKRVSGEFNEENFLNFADLTIDLTKKSVTRGEKRINLTSREFNLLLYFVKNPDKVISREEIARNVWNINFSTGTNVIDVYVNLLRNKVDKNFEQKLLHTVVGMGYVIREENK